MALRITHTNNSSGHDGTYVFRSTSPMDPQNLPAPIADAPPVALGATFEYIDSGLGDGTYYYRTQDHEGGQVSAVSAEVSVQVGFAAAIGDEVEGGIYAGNLTIDGTDYAIILAKQAGETQAAWKTALTSTSGTTSTRDGLANTQAMQVAGISSHPAADYCVNYTSGGFGDWYLPANDELLLISANLGGHPEFSTDTGGYRWSSTEASSTNGRLVRYSGAVASASKNDSGRYVRPARRVAL